MGMARGRMEAAPAAHFGVPLKAASPPAYYASAQGQTGAVLRLALHDIIKGQE